MAPDPLDLAGKRQGVRAREDEHAARGCARELSRRRHTDRPAAIVAEKDLTRRRGPEVGIDKVAPRTPPLAESPGQHGERAMPLVPRRWSRRAVGRRGSAPRCKSQHFDPFGAHDLTPGDHQHGQGPGPEREQRYRLRGRPDLPRAGAEPIVRQSREAIDTGALGQHQAAQNLTLRWQAVPCVREIGRRGIEHALQRRGLVNMDMSVDQESRRSDLALRLISRHHRRVGISLPTGSVRMARRSSAPGLSVIAPLSSTVAAASGRNQARDVSRRPRPWSNCPLRLTRPDQSAVRSARLCPNRRFGCHQTSGTVRLELVRSGLANGNARDRCSHGLRLTSRASPLEKVIPRRKHI